MNKLKKSLHSTIIVFFLYTALIVLISSFFPYLSKNILTKTSVGIYDYSFWVNFLVNANSSILDFLVIGVIVYFLDNRRSRKEIEREKKEKEKKFINEMRMNLEDYSSHSTIEINLKKLGILKRLVERNEKEINIQRIALNGLDVKGLDFIDSDLTGLNLEESRVSDCNFAKCNLRSVNFNKSKVKTLRFEDCKIHNMKLTNGKYTDLIFKNCDLKNSVITNSILPSCIFENCNMDGVLYTGSNMRGVNFKGSENINPQALGSAECINYIIAEGSVITELKRIRDDIKFRK